MKGSIRFLPMGDPRLVVFEREYAGERLVCAFNLGAEPATADLEEVSAVSIPGHGMGGGELAGCENQAGRLRSVVREAPLKGAQHPGRGEVGA